MAFQPIVDLNTNTIWGYEALVRGKDGSGAGAVLSHVTDENRYAFDQACRVRAIELASDRMPEGSRAKLSINFMPNAVYEPRACIRATLAALAKTGFSAERVMFEFTEQEHFPDPDHIRQIVEEYHSMGFTTAIDDFGAGFAGLGLLAAFRTDMIKLDMELIRGIDSSETRQAILEGIMLMRDRIGFLVLAEGVETEGEAAVLHGFGVDLMQGYLFAKPRVETMVHENEVNWPQLTSQRVMRA